MVQPGIRIGEAAARADASVRTLRYYEEVGLLEPSSRSAGGERRYSYTDIERVLRIRELKSLMGFNLDEIKSILAAEDELAVLKEEVNSGSVEVQRRREIRLEAIRILERVRERIAVQAGRLKVFDDEIARRIERIQAKL
ncbi:MAG: MerR family transcriptional regulator [Actinobacteria bacterium]|nr:MerR family transcriptional regulator [Actinomycetota bacterium]MCL5446412.1 MerR family transcriptional regulator [Actinomycetota bacterium]